MNPVYVIVHISITVVDSKLIKSSTARNYFLCWFLPSQSIHLHFFQSFSWVFPVLAVTNTDCCVKPQNKLGHPACPSRWLMQVPVLSAHRILIGCCRFPSWVPMEYKLAKKHVLFVCLGLHFKIVSMLTFWERLVCSVKYDYEVCWVGLVSLWNTLTESCGLNKEKTPVVWWLMDWIAGRLFKFVFSTDIILCGWLFKFVF